MNQKKRGLKHAKKQTSFLVLSYCKKEIIYSMISLCRSFFCIKLSRVSKYTLINIYDNVFVIWIEFGLMSEKRKREDYPDYLKCPLTLDIFREPVIASDGHT